MPIRQKPTVSTIYSIGTSEKIIGYCLVLSESREALNSIFCALWYSDLSIKNFEDLSDDTYLGNFFVTPDLIRSGKWHAIQSDIVHDNSTQELDNAKSKDFIGTKIHGSGIIIRLLEACFGLFPWD